jgi:hypothetical protein
MNILQSGGEHLKQLLWNLDSGLQIKEEAVMYWNGFLVKSWNN